MKIFKKGITGPKGFLANGIWSGVKRSGREDLSLIYSLIPCQAAAVFTKNRIQAAPLLVTKKHLRNKTCQAIICNSGNANCYTGDFGLLYAKKMTRITAEALSIKAADVLVASTGIIGKPLAIDKITHAIPKLVKGVSASGGRKAAKGIMTTDLTVKEICVSETIGGKTVMIGGCAKGSGMIEPNMATMLAFISTDLNISNELLKKALLCAVQESFNRITVDGCMSTNDMVTLMANGQAENSLLSKTGKDFDKFVAALTHICTDLAKKIVKDGEGATKFIEIKVKGAKTATMAERVAKAIANSNLVKTAAFGNNPNWGRVAAAVGATEVPVSEQTLKITFSSFRKKDINICVDLGLGNAEAVVYTSDLSYEYVRINGEYN